MNILITGATGLLGKSLIERRECLHNIIGLYLGNYKMPEDKNLTYQVLDVRDKKKLSSVFNVLIPDIAIHTAGISDVDFCEKNFKEGYESNVFGTKNIVELCVDKKVKLVYISSNAVFDGKNAPYREDDPTNPVNSYGKIKLECENIIRRSLDDYTIVRPILMYGWNNIYERNNLVTFLIDKLSKKKAVNMVYDVYENPLSSYSCADAVWSIVRNNINGIYHIAGRDIVNRYEYAMAIADVFDLNKNLIKPVNSSFFPSIAIRPKNTSYITKKIEMELDFRPLGLKEGLTQLKKIKNDGNGN